MGVKHLCIFHGGDILTLDPTCPQAEALAVADGRIAAVGSLDMVEAAVGQGAARISLDGGTLLPGFIDGHSHFGAGGINRLYGADLALSSLAEVKQALRRKLPDLVNGWLMGHSLDDWRLKEGRYPTREDLDEVSREVPIFLRHITGHMGAANSLALEMAGIGPDTPNPAGGILRRDASGRPDGVLEGIPAQTLVRKLIPPLGKARLKAAVAEDSRHYAARGITTAQGGPAFSPLDAEMGSQVTEIMVECAHDRTLGIRAVLFVRANAMERLAPYPFHISGADLSGDLRVILGAAKLWADGDPRGRTGYFSRPYPGLAKADYHGEFLYTPEELGEKILPMHAAGWQVAVHANGDAGIETVIQAMEYAQQKHPRPGARHLLIHCQYPHTTQLLRMARQGIQPCFFISPLYHWGEIHEACVGATRLQRFCPCREAEDLGMAFNLHSDAPITPVDPLLQVQAAVTRRSAKGNVYGKEQAVSVLSALRAVTLHAAFHNFEEQRKGSLSPGKLADMTLLEKNPLLVPADELGQIRIVRTYVDGCEVTV